MPRFSISEILYHVAFHHSIDGELGFGVRLWPCSLANAIRRWIERRAWNALAATLPSTPAQRDRRTPPPPSAVAVEPPAERTTNLPPEPVVLPPKSESQQAVEEMQQPPTSLATSLAMPETQNSANVPPIADRPWRDRARPFDQHRSFGAWTIAWESRDSAHRKLSELTRDEAVLGEVSNELQIATQLQDAEIRATCEEIANFDYESDLSAGCQKIVGRTNKLLNSNDAVRDALQQALAEVSQLDCRPPEECDRSDPLTGCVNRAGIEADLNAWWESDPEHRRMCVAKIDIDRLSEVNEQFGYRIGNEILKAVAQILEQDNGSNSKIARFSGQQFLVLCSDMELSAATNMIEKWRQTIENAHFEYKDFDIHVTVSCSVTQALAG